MLFNFKLISALLLTVSSTLAATNGKCTGKTGICIDYNTCANKGGTSAKGYCPNDPNNIRCCDNIPCSDGNGRNGYCLFDDQCTGSNKEQLTGKCPGGNNFKCCVDKKGSSTSRTLKYFTINELTRSDTATQKGINNTPSAAMKTKLEDLIINCLDPIRERFGKPIKVTSGYRCEALNKAVGGSSTSQHMLGEAADLQPVSGGKAELKRLFRTIVEFNQYDQLIYEKCSWVHVSCRNTSPRRQMLFYNGGGYENMSKSNYGSYLDKC